MNNKRKQSTRTLLGFLLSLLISGAIFSVPMVLAGYIMTNSIANTENFTEGYYPERSDDFTMLLGGQLSEGSDIEAILLLKVSPLDGEITVAQIPPSLSVMSMGRIRQLGYVWANSGGEEALGALSETLGIQIDRFALAEGSGFIRMVDTVGAVELVTDEDIKLTSGGVFLPTGNHLLDGRKLFMLITGVEDRQVFDTLADMAVYTINKRLPTMSVTLAELAYNSVLNFSVSSNLTAWDFEERKPAFSYVVENDIIAHVLPITTDEHGEGCFLTAQSVDDIREAFAVHVEQNENFPTNN